MNKNKKIFIVCGPTATGKSDFAVRLAKKINGEIVSADSRQVYKGLNIGSGKITKKEMKSVKHYLLDVISPTKIFSVAQFEKLALEAIAEIQNRNRVPIICGGTGFYIDSIIHNKHLPEIEPNKKLRSELGALNLEQLQKKLKKMDPERYKTIDTKNSIRLIRAIEIASALGKVPKLRRIKRFETKVYYLDFPDDVLKKRIKLRLEKRLKTGMITEVKKLHASGVSWKRLISLGLEYRYISFFLQGKVTKQEMTEKLFNEIWQYAKRQRTWFKKYLC